VLTQTYPDGQTITSSYTAQGWLSQVATSQGNTTLASNLANTGIGGAFGEITAMHLGGGYDYSASYDLLDRATDLKTKRTSDGTVMFDQSRTFDGAGNVTTTNMTMPGAHRQPVLLLRRAGPPDLGQLGDGDAALRRPRTRRER